MIYETVALWDGELFAHESLTPEEAREWAQQYPDAQSVRVWVKRYPVE